MPKVRIYNSSRYYYTNQPPRLLDPNNFLLPLLGAKIPLEVAVGMNGRVWINSKETRHTIAISRCIEAADPDGEGMGEAEIKKFLGTLDI